MDINKHLKFVKYIFFLLLILLIAVSVFPGNLVNLILIGDASTSPSSDKFSHFIFNKVNKRVYQADKFNSEKWNKANHCEINIDIFITYKKYWD